MKKTILKFSNLFMSLSLVFNLLCFASCSDDIEKGSDNNSEIPDSEKANLRIAVQAEEESTLTYPIEIFAFDAEGNFALRKELTSSDVSSSIQLKKGNYTIVALNGNKDGEYIIPENPTLSSVIAFTSDNHANIQPLMMGSKVVELTAFDTEIGIELNPMVTSIALQFSMVPTDTKSIELIIGQFTNELTFNNEASGEAEITKALTHDGNNVWATPKFYTFAGSKDKTILTIRITNDKGTIKTFTHTYLKRLEAGTEFTFKGNFTGDLNINASITIGQWNKADDIEFEFGDNMTGEVEGGNKEEIEGPGETEGGNEGSDSSNDEILTALPEQGDIYKNSLVVAVSNKTEKSATLFLMAPKEWLSILYNDVDAAVTSYTHENINDWRLPTDVEFKNFRTYYKSLTTTVLNNKLTSITNGDAMSFDADAKYVCTEKNVKGYILPFPDDETGAKTISAGSKTALHLRVFKEVVVTLE